MSKSRDTQRKEARKKPTKTLKERRAEKSGKRSETHVASDRIRKAVHE
ncbi:MAG: hypothetical protein R3323_10200 [Wenzhouxiangellaceae bacterium]|nr:hypothetical protein [Wenzhouxiangellaceae bacterium]